MATVTMMTKVHRHFFIPFRLVMGIMCRESERDCVCVCVCLCVWEWDTSDCLTKPRLCLLGALCLAFLADYYRRVDRPAEIVHRLRACAHSPAEMVPALQELLNFVFMRDDELGPEPVLLFSRCLVEAGACEAVLDILCSEFVQLPLDCPRCGAPFDDSLHLPRQLPCQHTICTQCVPNRRVAIPDVSPVSAAAVTEGTSSVALPSRLPALNLTAPSTSVLIPSEAPALSSTSHDPSLLECSICDHPFDEATHLPRSLVCSHTFCAACCLTLAKSHSISGGTHRIVCPLELSETHVTLITCPVDGNITCVADGDVSSLPPHTDMLTRLAARPQGTPPSAQVAELACLALTQLVMLDVVDNVALQRTLAHDGVHVVVSTLRQYSNHQKVLSWCTSVIQGMLSGTGNVTLEHKARLVATGGLEALWVPLQRIAPAQWSLFPPCALLLSALTITLTGRSPNRSAVQGRLAALGVIPAVAHVFRHGTLDPHITSVAMLLIAGLIEDHEANQQAVHAAGFTTLCVAHLRAHMSSALVVSSTLTLLCSLQVCVRVCACMWVWVWVGADGSELCCA
jgi:hypothetical protein